MTFGPLEKPRRGALYAWKNPPMQIGGAQPRHSYKPIISPVRLAILTRPRYTGISYEGTQAPHQCLQPRLPVCFWHTKRIIFHPRMMPGRAILDPELTLGLPAHLTAAVGMDALSHSLEAYSSPVFHPLAQGIALEAMRLVRDALPVAVKTPSDLAARSRMQVAAAMGSTAFQKGLGAMHALSHPCSSLLDTHHGLTNAVVMPYVLVFNRPAIDTKMAALARYLDLPDPSFSGVLDWILALREEIGIPHTLKDIGVDESLSARMARMAAEDPSAATNPVPLDAGALERLYLRAIDGVL